jgi:hypothetical protein
MHRPHMPCIHISVCYECNMQKGHILCIFLCIFHACIFFWGRDWICQCVLASPAWKRSPHESQWVQLALLDCSLKGLPSKSPHHPLKDSTQIRQDPPPPPQAGSVSYHLLAP